MSSLSDIRGTAVRPFIYRTGYGTVKTAP